MSYYLISILGLLPVFIILGISFNLLLGYGGLLSISQAGFFGVGAYATAILVKDYNAELLPALFVGGFLAAVVSISVGYAAGRLSDEFLFIVTIAVQVVLVELFRNLSLTGRSAGISAIPRPTLFGYQFSSGVQVALLAWIFCALVTLICWRIVKSPYGRLLRALREDVPAARSLGKSALGTKVSVFAVSAALAGVAGGLYATQIMYISPSEFTLDRSVEILSITIIGGLGTLWGPYVGALVVIALPELLSFADIPDSVAGPVNGIIYTLIVLVLLIFRPTGLVGRRPGPRASKTKAALQPSDFSHDEGGNPDDLFALMPSRVHDGLEKSLRCEGLSVSFNGIKAVNDVTLEIRPGKITALVGPNGAGKTTLFNLLSGALKSDTGRTFYGERDISTLTIEKRARQGVVRSFQEVRLFDGLTVIENMHIALTDTRHESILSQFVPRPKRKQDDELAKAYLMLQSLGLDGVSDVLAGELSYAEQKMLMIGRLLATGASCYLLDEPMSGLDHVARAKVTELLQRMVAEGTTICIVEHSMQVVREVASWVVFLDQGSVLTEGTPEDVISDPELTALYFGRPTQ